MTNSSSTKLPSYQKLRQHLGGDDDDDDDDEDNGYYYDFEKEKVVARRPRTNTTSSSVALRRRLRLSRLRLKVRVVNFRKLLLLKKKIKVMYKRVVQRFKEGQSHFGDLFAGNYMFLQVNPPSLKRLDVNRKKNDIVGGGGGGGGERKQMQLRHLQYVQSFPMGMGYTFPRN